MNKPAYAAIQLHSPTKPVLVFVSSRRQTRLTALDLIAFAAADQRPQQFLQLDESETTEVLEHIKARRRPTASVFYRALCPGCKFEAHIAVWHWHASRWTEQ